MSRTTERWRRRSPGAKQQGHPEYLSERRPLIVPPALPSTLRLKSLQLDEDLVVEGDVTISPDSPDSAPSDGLPPSASPTPTVTGGPRWLAVKWSAQVNVDLVTYEVHVGTTPSFSTSATTLATETPADLCFVRTVNGTPLVYDQDYYVKLIAKDIDGAATVGGEVGPTKLDRNVTDDLFVGSVTADRLAAVLVLASALLAGTSNAERVEIGFGTDGAGNIDSDFIGIRGYEPDGVTITFQVDVETGDVYLKGRLDFGNSRLLKENIIELGEINTSGFQTPALVQSNHSSSIGQNVSCTWPSATTFGNLLIAFVMLWDDDETAPSLSTPAGWTLETTQLSAGGELRLYMFRNTAGTSQSGTVSFASTGDTALWEMQLLEYSGVQIGSPDQEDSDTGAATTSLTIGTFPGATTQNEELWIGAIAHITTVDSGDPGGTPSNSYVKIRTTTNAQTDNPGADFKVAYLTSMAKNVTSTGTNGSTMTTNSNVQSFCGVVNAYKAKPAGVDTPDTNKIRIYNQNDRFEIPALFTKDDLGSVVAFRPFQDAERRLYHVCDLTTGSFNVTAGANAAIDGMLQGASNGTGSQVNTADPEAGHPGIFNVDPGTTTTGSAYINTRGTSLPMANNDIIRMTAVFKTPGTASNGTNRYAVAFGMWTGSDPMSVTAPGAWVFYSDVTPTIGGGGTLTAGNWGLLHGDGTDLAGDPLNDGSAAAVATNTWYRIDIEHKVGTGTSVWINGVKAVNNFGTNLFAGGVFEQVQVGVRKALGTTARPILVDLLAFEYIMATSR